MRLEVAGSGVREVAVGVVVVVCGGRGWKRRRATEREKGRDSLLGTTDSNVDQEQRTAFCALEHARSSYKPAILMDNGFLEDASSGGLGGEDWTLAVGDGRVKGTESNRSTM